MFGLSPYLLIGALLSGIALGVGGYIKGDADAANRYQAKITQMQLDAEMEATKIRAQLTAQANAAIATLETKNAKARVVYRTITQEVDKIVDRPIYSTACIDDDGLRLINLALGGIAVSPAAITDAAPEMPANPTSH